jgi:glycosyltransferase involved in cell wall biosynthesis
MKLSSLKILMVHPHDLWYDPWTIRPLALARELQKRGHKVTLCHLPRKEKPLSPPIRQSEPNDPTIVELKPRQVHFVHNFKMIYQHAQDCDIIHLQKCFASVALPVLWASRLLKKPLHYDWDDNETAISKQVEKRWFSRLQLSIYERNLPHFAHSLTFASQWIQDRALQLGFPKENTFHLPVGADLDLFHPLQTPALDKIKHWGLNVEAPIILYLGQMEGAAHAHLLIDAAPIVLQHEPSAQFLLVGGGEQLEELRKKAANSPASQYIFMPGYVEQKHVSSVIAASTVCVACFEDDEAARAKSPLKIAEYLASGKAIVASRVGEVPNMLATCGEIVQAGSAVAIAEGILSYFNHEQIRLIHGEKARKQAEQIFNWQSGADVLLHAYQTLM